MIIVSINKIDEENIEYKFSMDEYSGVVFHISVKIDAIDVGDESYLTAEYIELNHTKHNDENFIIQKEESKIICDAFCTSILNSLFEELKKI